jgi:hypothetical protein
MTIVHETSMRNTPAIMTSLLTNPNFCHTCLKYREGITANEFYVLHFAIGSAVVFEVTSLVIGT